MKTIVLDYEIYSGLAKAYRDNEERSRSFFSYNYHDNESVMKRTQWLKNHPIVDREGLVSALSKYNKKLLAGENTIKNIESLRDASTVAIVTGQQAGFLTGPLYTLYKAVTAIKQAMDCSKNYGGKVVPVFWIAGEDHDYGEIALNWTWADGLRKIRLPRLHKENEMVGTLSIPEEGVEIVDKIKEEIKAFPNGEYALKILDSFKPDNFSNSFAVLMLKLFEPWGLVLIDPIWPEIRTLESELFKKALVNHDRIREVLVDTSSDLKSNGFPEPLPYEGGYTGLFYVENDSRKLLKSIGNDTFQENGGPANWRTDELVKAIEKNPECMSSGAALRPVFQDAILPVLGVVLGPGEIAYHGQLKGVYEILDRQMPIIYLRESWVCLSPEMEVSKYDIQNLYTQTPEKWAADYILEEYIPGFSNKSEQHINDCEDLEAQYGHMVLFEDDLMQDYMQKFRHQLEKRMKYTRRMALRSLDFKGKERQKLYLKWASELMPHGILQERFLLPWRYLALYGEELLRIMIEAPFTNELRCIQKGGAL